MADAKSQDCGKQLTRNIVETLESDMLRVAPLESDKT